MSDASERLRALRADTTSLAELLAATGEVSVVVVREALRRLTRAGGRGEAEVLRWRIWRADPSLTGEFAACIATLGDRRAIDEALAVLRAGDAAPGYGERVTALALLAAFADPTTVQIVRGALDDPIGAVRQAAIRALAKLPPDLASQRAAAALLGDRDPQIRAAAVASVPVLCPDAGMLLGDLVEDESSVVRAALARSARLLDEQPARRLLGDPEIGVRELAAENAGARATPPLATALRFDHSPVVRLAAARRLGELRAAAASGPLIDALTDPEAMVRVTALRSLEDLHDHDTLTALLLDAARDRAHRDRAALLYAIKRLGVTHETIDTLSVLADDPDPAVQVALREIGVDERQQAARAAQPSPGIEIPAGVATEPPRSQAATRARSTR